MQLEKVKMFLKSPEKVIILAFAAVTAAGAIIYCCRTPPPSAPVPPDPLLPYVKVDSKWNCKEFNDFTSELNQERRDYLKKALKIEGKKFNSKEEEITAIRKQFLWTESHWGPYMLRNENTIPYHEVVQWTAMKLKVDKKFVDSMTTFELERKILEAAFAGMWDKLTPEQRKQVLEKMDNGKNLDMAGIAAMSGAGAIAALSTTVYLSGFAFYTAMSSGVAAIGSVLGVAVPMSAYLGTSGTVALLSGPVGWGIAAVAAAGGCWLIGGPDMQTTAAVIIQVHYTKIDALHRSGIEIDKRTACR